MKMISSDRLALGKAVERPRLLVKTVDRHTTAAMLAVSARTLQRWHEDGYGPKRRSGLSRYVSYTKAEVEHWAAKAGCGRRRKLSSKRISAVVRVPN
jgi:DNA-binding transcriptional MerR regulator